MSLLLSIDTAGSACSVALSTDEEMLSLRILREPRMHAARLVPLIREALEDARCRTDDIQAIAVSKGPGSYTGLRIGVSTAKGLAFGLGIPLVGVATFEALALANVDLRADQLVTTAPSRRNEAYWQVWSIDKKVPVEVTQPRSDSFEDIADRLGQIGSPVKLVGEGAESLNVSLERAGFSTGSTATDTERATIYGISELGHESIAAGKTEDIASFEPYYLMEFVARKGGSPFDRLPF